MVNAALAICAIALNHVVVSALKQRHDTFRKFVDGTPVLVVRDGEYDRDMLRGLRMSEEDVMMMARQKQILKIEDVGLAVVERDGSISIFKRE